MATAGQILGIQCKDFVQIVPKRMHALKMAQDW